MPVRMRAFCQFGKHRQIEVENEVTAYAEYANGATGSSSPPPPKHRAPTVWKLSAIAEKWLSKRDVCVSGGYVNLKQTLTPAGKMASVSRSAGKSSSLPPRSVANTLLLPVISPPLSCMANRSSPGSGGHSWSDAVQCYASFHWTDGWVTLPFDEQRYYQLLQEHIASSVEKRLPAARWMLPEHGNSGV